PLPLHSVPLSVAAALHKTLQRRSQLGHPAIPASIHFMPFPALTARLLHAGADGPVQFAADGCHFALVPLSVLRLPSGMLRKLNCVTIVSFLGLRPGQGGPFQ